MVELSAEDREKVENIVRFLWAAGVYPREIQEVIYDAVDETLEDINDEELALERSN